MNSFIQFAVVAQAGAGALSPSHAVWSFFNDLLGFTANVWQIIDGLVFTAVAVYLLMRYAKSVLGHDDSTVKASTSFDYLGSFPRESNHKIWLLEEVWKLPFHEKTVKACFKESTDELPYLCIANRGVWLALHDFYSGLRNEAVADAVDTGRDHALHRMSHVLAITFGDYEMRQARIEDLAAPKLVNILSDPVGEFEKAALSSRDMEMARQLALIELAALVCWKAPHLVSDALMEPELGQESLLNAPGQTPIEKKLNLEAQLAEAHRKQFKTMVSTGKNLGKLILLNRQASYDWLRSIGKGPIPELTAEESKAVTHRLQARERFKPWTHRLIEAVSRMPYIRKRFPYAEYVQHVGRLEADGWFVRVYVNHLA